MEGVITDIQRFSLKDGPGIRTTVFLQGCNMNCAWCHNPETISCKPQLMYYREKCMHCASCVGMCPTGALSIEEGQISIDRKKCTNCGKCTEVCYGGALVMSGRKMTAEAVVDEVMQDEIYYRNSGGGVTISGGEVFMQYPFAYEILKQCKEKNVSAAIETNLNFEWKVIQELLPVVDLVMCDLKLMDAGKHGIWTGTGNEKILNNLKELGKTGKPVIVRTPVIPGVNDNSEEIQRIAAYIKDMGANLLYYELLNFNPLGNAKYVGLNKEYSFDRSMPLPEQKMKELAEVATMQGIKVKIG